MTFRETNNAAPAPRLSWQHLRAQARLIIGICFVAVGVTTMWVCSRPPMPEASIRVEALDVSAANFDEHMLNREILVIRSTSVLYPVIDLLHLSDEKSEYGHNPNNEIYRLLLNCIRCDIVADTPVIEIRVQSADREQASQMAEAIAQSYAAFRDGARRRVLNGQVADLTMYFAESDQAVASLEAEVKNSTGDLSAGISNAPTIESATQWTRTNSQHVAWRALEDLKQKREILRHNLESSQDAIRTNQSIVKIHGRAKLVEGVLPPDTAFIVLAGGVAGLLLGIVVAVCVPAPKKRLARS